MSVMFGSVCSGIEAASVAWEPMEWKAAWFAEVDPFPSALLSFHYPDTPNLGDMTKIADQVLADQVPAPDVLVGGTPCQSFSIAGLRQSLSDERGQLTLEFVRLANAIDTKRMEQGRKPCIVIWENVPGVTSTKDNALGCFLGALAGESCALQPPGGKWSNAGGVLGPQRSIAWRLVNAEYFGVAQRRRRIFLIASARTDIDPSEILFEYEGERRDFAPSRGEGEEIATTAGYGLTTASGKHTFGTLLANCGSKLWLGNQEALSGDYHILQPVAYAFDSLASNSMRSSNPHSGCRLTQTCKTLDTTVPCPSKNQGGIGIVQSYAIAGNIIGRDPKHGGNGLGFHPETCYTLTKADQHGVVYAFQQNSRDEVRLMSGHGQIVGALSASSGAKQQNYIYEGMTLAIRRLMPVECERLQGFPDDYTKIPYRNKSADDCPDSPRYKALGNSMAVPCMEWIGQRIQAVLREVGV